MNAQVVVLGAGMDTRFHRLGIFEGITWYEVDLHPVLTIKNQRLRDILGYLPENRRIVETDLSVPTWKSQLQDAGFNPSVPTIWLVEGLLMYLRPDDVARLVIEIDQLSAPKSHFGASLVDKVSLEAALESSSRLQRSWKWAPEIPRKYFSERLGPKWNVRSVSMGDLGEYPIGANYEIWHSEAVARWRRKGKTVYVTASKGQ